MRFMCAPARYATEGHDKLHATGVRMLVVCLGFAGAAAVSCRLVETLQTLFFDLSSVKRSLILSAAGNLCPAVCCAQSSSIALSGERNTLRSAGSIAGRFVIPEAVSCMPLPFWRSSCPVGRRRQLRQHPAYRATDATSGRRAHRRGTANQELSILEMKDLSKDSVTWLEVGDEADGQRIDNFLLKVAKGVPKSHIYRILRSGEVRVNKGRVSAEYRLQLGDTLRVPPIRTAERPSQAAVPARDFDIAYEDEALIVVDKPAGTAVHGGSGVSFGVIEQLRRARPLAKFLELAHRLDRETSGLLVVAKKRMALTRLHDMFRDGGINKRYLALVKGRWRNELQHVRLPLHKFLTAEGERRVSVDADGKTAHSIVRLVARWENFSLVEVELKTGRTHQIRVHLAHLGFPIAGDDKYGDFALNKVLQKAGLGRMFLHAAKLALPHPLSGAPIELQSALPSELSAFIRQLERNEKREYGQAL
jgi:23S rRNA pseudouridine955/2504/2580 synthase